MLATPNGNLIFAAQGSAEAPTSIVSLNTQIAASGMLSSSSATSAAGTKAIGAQFFSNSAAILSASKSKKGGAAAASPVGAASVLEAVTTKGTAGLISAGAIALFDSPCYVTATTPDVVNTKTAATFFAGGYSVLERNERIFEEMESFDAHRLAEAEAEAASDEDDNADDNAAASKAKKNGAKKPSANLHLAAVVVKGHRAAVLSPCGSFVYIVRTDSFSLDWALDLSAALPSSSSSSVRQLILLDAHRLLVLTTAGALYVATRPLAGEAAAKAAAASAAAAAAAAAKAAGIYDNNVARRPAGDKFRYFVTYTAALVAAPAGVAFAAVEPLRCVHAGAKGAGAITVDIIAVAAPAKAGANTYSIVAGAVKLSADGSAAFAPAASSSSKAFASISTASAPSSFAISVAASIEDATAAVQRGGKKKAASSSAGSAMTVLVTPIGAPVVAAASAAASIVVSHLVALDEAMAVASVTPVSVAAANVAPSSSSSSAFFVAATAAELLTENMLAVGLVAGEGKAPSAASAVVGKVVFGTFYFEKEGDRSAGVVVDTSAIHLTAADEGKTASSAVSLAPVGFHYNSRLNHQSIVAISSLASAAAASSSSATSSSNAISIRMCGVSLLSGFPTNGSAIAKASWTAVSSVLSASTAGASLAAAGANALAAAPTLAEEADRYTSGGKRAGLEGRNFVTLNYPIVTLSGCGGSSSSGIASGSSASSSDPYRISAARIFGRCAITAPVAVQQRALAQWPNAVIGVLKMLVDYTAASMAAASDVRYAHETRLLAGEEGVEPLAPSSAASILPEAVLATFKRLAMAAGSLAGLFTGGSSSSAATSGAAASAAFEVSIITHAFHPSAIRNALRRLPFAVAAAAAAEEESSASAVGDAANDNAADEGMYAGNPYFDEEAQQKAAEAEAAKKPLGKRAQKDAAYAASVAAAAERRRQRDEQKRRKASFISTTDLMNGLFAALLDSVDTAAAAEQLTTAVAAASSASAASSAAAADSFLRAAVGALEICHHLVTLQAQLGASVQGPLISRFVLLLRALRVLGEESDQIAGRLGATLDRQRFAAANAAALAAEKEQIRSYQQQENGAEAEAEAETTALNSTANNSSRQRVNLSRADIRHKISAVGTGNVADGLSAQLASHKKVLDLVDAKIEAKLAARRKEAAKKKATATAAAPTADAVPLYAPAGMRPLKSDFQNSYERFLLLGESGKKK